MNVSASDIIKNNLIESRLFSFLQDQQTITEVDAVSLITPNRFDILIKLAYLHYKDKSPEYANFLYDQHIICFGAGTYSEPEKSHKNSLDAFLSDFNDIERDIAANGFQPDLSLIPLARDGSILNGAHRVAAAIFHNKKINVVKLDVPPSDFSLNFFVKNCIHWSVVSSALELLSEYNKNIRVAIIWPKAKNLIQYRPENIYAEKTINLSLKEMCGFIRQVYVGEQWLGKPGNDYSGAQNKALNCFSEGEKLRVIVFEKQPDQDLLITKEDFRAIAKLGKHSLHISDNVTDTMQVVNFVFNENSLEFLKIEDSSYDSHKDQTLNNFYNRVTQSNLNISDILVDSGTALEVYGIRTANDLDVISSHSKHDISNLGLGWHNEEYDRLQLPPLEYLSNPAHFLWYNRIKVMAINTIRNFKSYRAEEKDMLDVALIDNIHSPSRWKIMIIKFRQKKVFLKRRAISALKRQIVNILKTLRLFEKAKAILSKNHVK